MDYETNTNPNMKPCEICGQLIAKSAKKCPHCGAKVKRPIYKNGCLISILVIFILILGTFASCKIMNSVKENEEYLILGNETITLKEFYEEVKDNKVKFASKYKGEKVTIVGRIESIEEGSYNTNLNHSFNAIISIRCDNTTYATFIYVEAGSMSKASQFEVGDLVKVTGKFSSNLYSDFYMYGPNTITKVSD